MYSRILHEIKMDIIQAREDLDYESGDYDIDMVHEAMRDAFNICLSIITVGRTIGTKGNNTLKYWVVSTYSILTFPYLKEWSYD